MPNPEVTQTVDCFPASAQSRMDEACMLAMDNLIGSDSVMIDFHIRVDPMHGAQNCFGIGSALAAAKKLGIKHAGLIVVCDGLDFHFMQDFSKAVRTMSLHFGITAWSGVELVRIPLPLLEKAVSQSRTNGAQLVLARGECIYDDAEHGLNFAAINAGVDILSCPGILDKETAALAAEKDVYVEFSSSPSCGIAAACTIANCLDAGCSMVCGSSASNASELPDDSLWEHLIAGSCFGPQMAKQLRANLLQSGMRLAQTLMQSELKLKKPSIMLDEEVDLG